jgi:hypothetical protein
MKRTAICPLCSAPMPAFRVYRNDAGGWVVQFGHGAKDQCPGCGVVLKRVSVDKQPWTSLIILAVLSPLLAGTFACGVLAEDYGMQTFYLFVPAFLASLAFAMMQAPFTNAFVVRDSAADLREKEALRKRQREREQVWAERESKYRDIGMAILIFGGVMLVILVARLVYSLPDG